MKRKLQRFALANDHNNHVGSEFSLEVARRSAWHATFNAALAGSYTFTEAKDIAIKTHGPIDLIDFEVEENG